MMAQALGRKCIKPADPHTIPIHSIFQTRRMLFLLRLDCDEWRYPKIRQFANTDVEQGDATSAGWCLTWKVCLTRRTWLEAAELDRRLMIGSADGMRAAITLEALDGRRSSGIGRRIAEEEGNEGARGREQVKGEKKEAAEASKHRTARKWRWPVGSCGQQEISE
jgi:hypothetical protein